MSEQRWRIVDARGAVREVALRWERDSWVAERMGLVARNGDPMWCVADFARFVLGVVPVQLLAPGEMTRAEAVAAALAEHQRHTDAAVDGVRAMLPAALATARREGAEAMREAAARLCADAAGGEYSFAVSATPYDEEHAAQYAARASALRQASRAVAALPLPGDATGEHAPTPGPVCPATTEGT